MTGNRNWRRRLFWAPVVSLYLLAFPYHPGLHSANELCRLWQTYALVEHGKVSLNQAMQELGPARDLSVKDGLYYPSKAPFLSFAAVPVYWALKAVHLDLRSAGTELGAIYACRLFLTVLPTLLLLILLTRFLRTYVSATIAHTVVATYALGSLGFSYSLLFMSHQTAAVFLFAAFYSLWRTLRRDWGFRGTLACGVAASAALATEYTSALGIACLAGFALWATWRSAGSRGLFRLVLGISFGAAPLLVALLAYHHACFGNPFHTGYKYLNDAAYQGWHQGGFLGIKLPDPGALFLSLFSPLRGLLILSPFLALGFIGLRAQRRGAAAGSLERAVGGFTVALVLGYAYFTSSFSYASWGWTTGPRHLTGLVPFLLLPLSLLASAWTTRPDSSSLARGVLAAACAASVIVTGCITLVNYIPDDVSNPLYALAWPLLRSGRGCPSLLNFFGLTNPATGWVLLLLLSSAAVMIAFRWVERRWDAAGIAVAGLVLYLAAYAATTRHDEADAGALRLLSQEWLAQPGESVSIRTPQ